MQNDVRLIDRKVLLKALRKEKRECEKDGEEFGGESILYAEAFEDVIDMVKNLPVVDAVPVVRCRECKHRGYDVCPMCHDEYTYDEDYGGDYHTVDNTTDDGFCHNGAKMDGGAEE